MSQSKYQVLEDISWKEFFTAFEAELLAMQFVDEPKEGKTIPIARFVNRATVQADDAALTGPTAGKPES
jgi:hypothetical protein